MTEERDLQLIFRGFTTVQILQELVERQQNLLETAPFFKKDKVKEIKVLARAIRDINQIYA